MSQWTHVAATFRVDSIGEYPDEELIKIFGKEVDFYDMDDVEYDEKYEVKDKDKYLPMGSEGTLEMSIWHNPDKSCMASTTVSVFGDLRDYNSFKELEDWFNRVCDKLFLRQAVMHVDVEGLEPKVYSRC